MTKRVAIWGTGNAGRHLASQIKKVGAYTIDAFLNSDPQESDIDGIPVRRAAEYLDSEDPDIYMIAAGHQRSVFDMLDILFSYNVDDIYFLQDIAGKNRLDLFDENGKRINSRLRKIRNNEEKPVLPYFEVPIVDDCNLNCKGCIFGCNEMVHNNYMPLEQLEKDLRRMKELFSDILWIRILGGEPLLHPEIMEAIYLFREIYPDTEIDLCTNGLLLLKMSDEFFDELKEKRITIHVSGYPPVIKMRDKITGRLKEYGVEHTFIIRNEFFKYYRENVVDGFDENHLLCPTRGCPELYYGKLLKCSAYIAFSRFNNQFGTHFDLIKDDYVSIHNQEISGNRIIDFIKNPIQLCRYCDTKNIVYYSWLPGNNKSVLSDYILD